MTRPAALALAACAGLAFGCFTPTPILYPNDTVRSNPESRVDEDIADCEQLAKEYKASPNQSGDVARSTVEDAAIGSAAGAAGGAVVGNAGGGAAAGAAGGAAAGLLRAIFRIHRDPNPAYRTFMERCLGERGYEVIGWDPSD